MISAVVVCYNPDLFHLKVLCTALNSQADQLILVDNSAQADMSLVTWLSALHIIYIPMPTNVGVARAQNVGIEQSLSDGADYVVLFDQDSEVSEELIVKLHQSFTRSIEGGINLACVGARPFCLFEKKLARPRVQAVYQREGELSLVRQVIASSMMISKQALERVGFMESELFIDGVDHEWCWRAADKGYRIAVNESCVLPHRLGDKRGSFLGVTYKVGSPVRLYYQFRNILVLSRRAYVPTYWKVRNLGIMPFRFFVMALFEKPRGARVCYMLKGAWHGILGKNGP